MSNFREAIETELNAAVTEQKNLMAVFYAKMSGQQVWRHGEKDAMELQFEALSRKITRLQSEDAAKWFATLPGLAE